MAWIHAITESLATLAMTVGSPFFTSFATVPWPTPGSDEYVRFYSYEDPCAHTPNGDTVVFSTLSGTGCWLQWRPRIDGAQVSLALGYTPASAAALVGYVPTTRTVNGQALSANVSISKADVGLGSVANTDTTNASSISSGTLSAARLPVAIDAANVANGTVSNAEFQALDGVTSAIQAQINGKLTTPAGTSSQCVRGDGTVGACPGSSGTVTSVATGAGLTGGPITGTGTIALTAVGTAGSYNGSVTTDAQGRVTAGTALTINDAPGRSLVTSTSATGFQVSSTRVARVCYEGSISTTSTIGGPASATVFLETSSTNSTTPSDWTIKAKQAYSNTITLAIVLNQAQGNNWAFCRDIPAGAFVRLRSGSVSGTASASLNAEQQETLY